ncbi:hypothetical protein DP149_09550 [Clostridium tetani]|uniref:Uncharacterized protein n=1 Tax=Clostridium tetani (strain Massachusetts / E88) TaxID=212717 RepID=Q893X1_CLOTE|nr:hypothetical protein [Clostridium tetani]AAO36221.1 hypothetical protein CTC_01686 [Clostridium tetani E88]KGI37820.1 hypothetical protein KY52_09770 [Clostridium tetani]KGI45459.1 hypothetical protein KY54_04990 [Clostridium tetani]KHO31758.1 hypothetical protein OR63_08595 [Clostridium tetani]KIG22044.1 hypothetical protein RS78_01170 [Clostridium tetani]
MNWKLFKLHIKDKIGVYFFILIIIITFIIRICINKNDLDLYIMDGLIKFIMLLTSFIALKINTFVMYIQFSKTRKSFFKDRLKYSIIMTLFLTIISTIFTLFFKEQVLKNHLIIDYKLIIMIFIVNFLFYLMCFSLEIFIIILRKSSYEALQIGMIFFYIILAIRFGVVTASYYSFNNFVYFVPATMAIIIFNLKMSHIALETVEIN